MSMRFKVKSSIILPAFSIIFSACQSNERQSNSQNVQSSPTISATATPISSVSNNANPANANSAEKEANQTIKPASSASATPKATDSPAAPKVSGTPKFKNYTAKGVIKKIDIENNSVTIDHEDIGDYMVGMEMPFPVVNKNLLKNLAVGDKVSFVLETGIGVERIVGIRKL